jgi:rhamnogalacturonan endolyase
VNDIASFLRSFACALVIPAAVLAQSARVTLTEDADLYTLANGIVTAKVAKASGDLVSLRYKGLEMLATFLKENGEPDLEKDPPGANPNGLNPRMTDHQYGFWSHDAMGPKGTAPTITTITIDPNGNGGARAEVSVKGVAQGRKMGTGPGARPEGQFAADIEIRYALGRGESGVYTYCIFEHLPEYPATSLGEARFCAKLADHFDWMSIAPHRNKLYPKELREGDKYVYTVVQSENPAFGWSSTTEKVGFFLLNPSMEYISGGPTKVEFLGHRDTNRVAAPCVLNYWRSSHYGGALVDVGGGEHWTKVVGPFLLYVNAGATPQAMYDDARTQQRKESGAWPYGWVNHSSYPTAADRATVSGRLVLSDPRVPGAKMSLLQVGLTAPAYVSPREPAPNGAPPPKVDWQIDAKHYQFWTRASDDGRFEIAKVRPGRYTLHAFADGVLGEFAQADIVVERGRNLDLGRLTWTPVRRGRQLWDIGIPNRNGSEFAGADIYYDPEISLKYAKLFPNDVNYTIGRSDFRKDWFFQHVPHNEDPNARAEPFFGVRANGRATPFVVNFELASAPPGTVTLRLAICGTGAREVAVTVNGNSAGKVALASGDGVIARHGIQGIWYERELTFDRSLLNVGMNMLTLTVPAGPINNGVVYDYLRLELDEAARVTSVEE